MKTYEVIVTRDTTESTTIQVQADSPEAAEREALAESRDGRYVWEQDFTPNASKDHYATSVMEEDSDPTGPLASCETLYLVEGGPITQEQIDEGTYPTDALGVTEWQLSDGPPGERGYSEDFHSFEEALAEARKYPNAKLVVDLLPDAAKEEPKPDGKWINAFEGDSDEIPAGAKLARLTPATAEDVEFVLSTEEGDNNGRSGWYWIRFATGDLMLGLFPCGETYLAISEPGKAPFHPD